MTLTQKLHELDRELAARGSTLTMENYNRRFAELVLADAEERQRAHDAEASRKASAPAPAAPAYVTRESLHRILKMIGAEVGRQLRERDERIRKLEELAGPLALRLADKAGK